MAHTVHQESEAYETLSGATAEAAPPPLVAGPAPRPLRLSAVFARIGVSPAMVKGAVWSMGGYGAGAVASFVVQVILARALEATRYGVYSYLLAWVNVAVLAGQLELDTVAIRFISTYDGRRRGPERPGDGRGLGGQPLLSPSRRSSECPRGHTGVRYRDLDAYGARLHHHFGRAARPVAAVRHPGRRHRPQRARRRSLQRR